MASPIVPNAATIVYATFLSKKNQRRPGNIFFIWYCFPYAQAYGQEQRPHRQDQIVDQVMSTWLVQFNGTFTRSVVKPWEKAHDQKRSVKKLLIYLAKEGRTPPPWPQFISPVVPMPQVAIPAI